MKMLFWCWWAELKWWWVWTRPMQNVKVKFVQDGCLHMTEEEWGDWLNRLPVGEFLCLMFIGGADEQTEMIAIETWQPQLREE